MTFQYSPFILPLIAAALISGWVAWYAWSRRVIRSAVTLSLLGIAIAEWSLGYVFEITAVGLPAKMLFGKLQYIGITIVPLAWAIFAYNHVYQSSALRHRSMIGLSITPLLTILLAFTTEAHGLVWRRSEIAYFGSFSALRNTYGAWFWIHSVYSYLLLLAGAFIILRSLGHNSGHLYRGQIIALLTAVLAPWIGNFLYLTGAGPFPNLDLTPFAFTISVLALTWGIFGFRLINLAPLARDIVIESMTDGMIVIDLRDQIADLNLAARRILEMSTNEVIGRNIVEVVERWPSVKARLQDLNALGRDAEGQEEIVTGQGAERQWFEVRLTPLFDRRKRLAGRVIIFQNIWTKLGAHIAQLVLGKGFGRK